MHITWQVIKGILIGMLPLLFYLMGVGVTQLQQLPYICQSNRQEQSKVWALTTLIIASMLTLLLVSVGLYSIKHPANKHGLTGGYVTSIVGISAVLVVTYAI
jgi:branched-subunit amino acid transport protein AzlD